MDNNRIRVVARIRPKTRREAGERCSVTRLDDYTTLSVAGSTEDDLQDVRASVFRFDSVYNEDDDQVTIYEEECAEIVDHCLAGMPASVLAYGQTGSGKTHTVLGKTSDAGGLHGDSGIFLRVFCDLFRCGVKSVQLAAIELYLDEVLDLLDDRVKRKLRDTGSEVAVSGMKEVTVSSLEDVLAVFEVANAARAVSSTDMNQESSRSHAIFFITLPPSEQHQRPNPTRLMLVDLAGSERIKKSNAQGGAIAEAAAINASLSTLGTVVHSMYTGSNHIPYRDSKLTGVLKGTFSNKMCKVLLIGQFSPAVSNSLESISTAKFCDRVKGLACNASLLASGIGGSGDAETDKEILNAIKCQDELSTEMRIARTLLNLPRSRRTFKPASASSTTGQQQRFVINSEEDAAALKAELQNEIQQAEQQEARDAVQRCDRLKQKIFQSHVAKRVQLDNDLLQYQQKLSGAKELASKSGDTLEQETAAKTTEAKRAKKRRLVLEEKLAELRKAAATVDHNLEVTPENYVLPPSLVDFDADDDPEKERAERMAECNHAIVSDFYNRWKTLSRLHADTIKIEDRTEKISAERHTAKNSAHSFFVQQFASDVVAFSWRRACDISEGVISAGDPWAWSDVVGCSRFLIDACNWVPNPLELVPEFPKMPVDNENTIVKTVLDDDEMGVASSSSSSKGAVAADSSSKENATPTAGSEQNNNNNKKTVRRKKTAEEMALAEKHYLMGIYDSKTLVSDIIKFLANGTKVMKHGRNGDPHKRHAWIKDRTLYWVDPDPTVANRQRHSVNVSGIGTIVLGPFSKVFKRHPVTAMQQDYFLSFSVHMKDGSRSVDFVCENLVDFEAWVIGLVNLCGIDAEWGKALNCVELEPQEYGQLNSFERALCAKENIFPSTFIKVKAKVTEMKDDISLHMRAFRGNSEQAFQTMGGDGIHMPQMSDRGAVLMTKGELRYHCSPFQVCIFRVCRLFEFFRDAGILFDPEYTPICKFGASSRAA